MTDHAFVNGGLGLCADCGCTESAPRHNLQPPSELDRATQALHDAAVAMSVASHRYPRTMGQLRDIVDTRNAAQERLFRATEDYAEAYLRG